MATSKLTPQEFVSASAIRRRWSSNSSVALTNSESTTAVLDLRGFAQCSIFAPASVTAITWYGSDTEGGTYSLIDGAGTSGVQSVTASRWAAIPEAVFAHGWVKAVITGAASGTGKIVGKG